MATFGRDALHNLLRSQFSALLLILAGVILAVQGMWAIDFVIWFPSHDIYVYVPFVGWGSHLSEGDAVNWGYWSISLGLILSVVGGFAMGESRREQRIGTGKTQRSTGILAVGIALGVLVSAGYIALVYPHPLSYYTNSGALLYNALGYGAVLIILVVGLLAMRGRGRKERG